MRRIIRWRGPRRIGADLQLRERVWRLRRLFRVQKPQAPRGFLFLAAVAFLYAIVGSCNYWARQSASALITSNSTAFERSGTDTLPCPTLSSTIQSRPEELNKSLKKLSIVTVWKRHVRCSTEVEGLQADV